MIRFKCIYCGQKILVDDDKQGKKGHCPKCSHLLVVPRDISKRPSLSADISEKAQKSRETLAMLSTSKDMPDDADFYGEKAGWFIPSYDELSLFLMSATLILLLIFNSHMRQQIYSGIIELHDLRIYLFGVIFIIGMCLSVFHIFTKRKKSDFEKDTMLFFAVVANAFTGIIAGGHVLLNSDTSNLLIVFPLWNIINGIIMLLLFRGGFINEKCIADREAAAREVILGLFSVIVIFILCDYVFKLHWAITFSICIVYTTSFDKALQSVFPGLAIQKSEVET